MDDGYWPWRSILLIILFLLFALIHGFEKAMQGVNDSLLEDKAREGDRHASLLLDTMQQQASFTCIRLVLMFGTGYYMGARIWPLCLSAGTKGVLMIPGTFLLFLVVGIMVPRKMAARKSDFWLNQCLGIIRFILAVFYPLTAFVDIISNLLLRMVGYDVDQNDDDVTAEEIISMVNEGNEQGVLEDSEAEMIHNIITFRDKDVSDIMTRRLNIIAIEGHQTLQDVRNRMMEDSKSRFPVYDEELDNILGILYFRDVMVLTEKEELLNRPVMEIPGLLRKAEFIPETRKIDSIFQYMQLNKLHIMLVVDEYGQLAGLVTMEDLLEEIVGNIFDEFDEVEQPYVEKTGEEEYILDGMTPLDEVKKLLNMEFDTEDMDTINGFLLYKLGYFPEEGEETVIRLDDYDFTILQVENKVIQKIRVAKTA
ncbi:MAG: hemolysin family protein [Lachnospiraceae bacterium]|nr:hemolysin family protein [Lachnospiraceae bacterium]MDY4970305.1 hemolysin family protein [Lachnospiraceae bacterium]